MIIKRASLYRSRLRGEGKTCLPVYFTSTTLYRSRLRGEGKTRHRSVTRRKALYRSRLRGEGKTAAGFWNKYPALYRSRLRGEGKTKLAAGWRVRLGANLLIVACPATAAHANPPLIWLRPAPVSANDEIHIFNWLAWILLLPLSARNNTLNFSWPNYFSDSIPAPKA